MSVHPIITFPAPASLALDTTMFMASRCSILHCLFAALIAAAISALTVSALAPSLPAQTGTVTGKVLTTVGEHPISQAAVEITDLKLATRTDSAGNFHLSGVTSGTHRLLVRQVGFSPLVTTIVIANAQKLAADFLIEEAPIKLNKIDVTEKAPAAYNSRLAGFEERRHMGLGKFVGADVFEREDGRPVSSFLQRTLPGTNVVISNQSGGARYLASNRSGSAKPCYVHIVLNDISVYSGYPGEPNFNVDNLDTKRIIGFEWYSVANTPPQFNMTGASQCGTAVIWTK